MRRDRMKVRINEWREGRVGAVMGVGDSLVRRVEVV